MFEIPSTARVEEQVPGLLVVDGSAFREFRTFDLAPPRVSQADTGKYRATDPASLIQNASTIRPRNGAYPRLNGKAVGKSFSINDRGGEFSVDPADIRDIGGDEDAAIQGAAQPVLLTVMAELHKAALDALFGLANTMAGAAAWSSGASSPLKDWHTFLDTKFIGSAVLPNCIAMSWKKAMECARHAEFTGMFKGASTDFVPPDVVAKKLAEAFNVEEVVIDRTRRNSADQGLAASYAYLAPQDKIVGFRRERGLLTAAPQTIRTFVRTITLPANLETMSLPSMELLADAIACWTWPVPNPGGRAGVVALLAEPNVVNAETGGVITGI